MPFSYQTFAFESLLTSAKMTQMMTNDLALKASLVGSNGAADGIYAFTNSGHTHNGSDSALTAIPQSGLDTSLGTVDISGDDNSFSNGHVTLPGGQYGFYPRFKTSTTGGEGMTKAMFVNSLSSSYAFTSYAYLEIDGKGAGAGTITFEARQRYMNASPPYMIGDTQWGHFIFLLREVASGKVISAYEAPDPPWAYNGYGEKDSLERIESVPHPFLDYYNQALPEGLEIVLVDVREMNIKKWQKELDKERKGILNDLDKVKPGKLKKHSTYGIPEIPGFTDKVKIRVKKT
jgi:hypothetical protein